MRKLTKKAAVLCMAGIMTAGGTICAAAQSPTITAGEARTFSEMEETSAEEERAVEETIRIWGTVKEVGEDSILIENQSGTSFTGDIVLHISEEATEVIDVQKGYPADPSGIKAGDVIYAYIGQAMALSLPPQTSAEMILTNIPAGFKVPDYVTVKTMVWNEDTSWTLTAADGTVYEIPGNCPVTPYKTRQMVFLPDVTEGRKILIWSNQENEGEKILLFNEE